MLATQQNSPIAIETFAGEDALQIRRLEWRESLGQPFEGTLELVSTKDDLDLANLLMTPICVRIDGPEGKSNYLHGLISQIENLGRELRLVRYRATVVPCISLMLHSGGCRIFQEFTALDIVKKIFSNFGFSGQLESRLSATYPKRDYCVQYCESDFNFIHRILQEEGIYYFFEYTNQKHCMILADDLQAHRAAAGNETVQYRPSHDTQLEEYLTGLSSARQFVTGGVSLSDYDFQKPRTKLEAKQLSTDGNTKWTNFHFPGNFKETSRGQTLAKIRQQSQDAAGTWIAMEGKPRSLRSGNVFKLAGHDQSPNNIEYLTTSTHLSARAGGLESGDGQTFSYSMSLRCQPSKLPFRPELTARRTRIAGPHVATVSGKKGEEIWTDKFGRIKVQFPWDLDGKSDELSSCWIRVAQAWTGKSWGAMSIPRIGEEVIVEFIDGNPDHPIVTGRVYNADMMPPEALATAQAKTIFRTHSTKGGDKNAFHELSFDDTKDAESIYLHSERDFTRVVENNDETLVGFEKMSPGNQSVEVFNDSSMKIGQGSGEGSLSVEIEKDRKVTLAQGDDSLNVQKGNVSVKVDAGSTTFESAKAIELKCGQSKLTITPDKIVLESPAIEVNATGKMKLGAADATLEGSGKLQLKGGATAMLSAGAELTVKGAMVKIN